MRHRICGLAILLACVVPGTVSGGQQQTQTIPDAPTPNPSNDLKTLTTGVAPGVGSNEPKDDQGTNTTQVPATAPTPAGPDTVQQNAPDIPAAGQYQKGLTTFSTRVDAVTVPVTVLDKKHQQVAGLTWRDFQIYENNIRQTLTFFSADAVGLSVALVIDQSMPRDVMEKVNASLAAIQGAFTGADEVAVFTYADGVNNPTDFTAAQGARLPAVLQASKKSGDYFSTPINSGPFFGGPRINGQSVDPNLDAQRGSPGVGVIPKEVHTLNDAILAAGKSLSTRPKGMRRIVYVISDGKESRSKTSFKEVVRYLQGNRVAVYGTLVGDSATWGLGYLDKLKIPLLPLSPDNILPKYADATGGQLYSEFSENGIQRSFGDLASLARTQYTLGYNSKAPALDSRYRVVDVRVLRPNLDVLAEKGYYPTATNLAR